ncbi:hypothetical protein FOZ61_000687 [Perkinsus olseni]|uniref:Eukaryotic translation initiation factor 5B n=1 Tax=Perkinsus olseni TaxID=32597 RepID=A0A7J6KWF7_PEROL|nr:hypothetical protein FOZ61_000687 [Perkinsus olseni]KAF4650931.1 hypothetical protein FOL46_000634 [Perkinsus olseni]
MSTQSPANEIAVHPPEEKKKKRKQKNREHTVPQVASTAPSCPAAAAAQAAVAFLKQREEERKRAEESLEAERAFAGQKGAAVNEAPRQTSASGSSKKKKKNKSAKPAPLTERDRQYRTFLEESGQILGDSPDKNRARTQSELYGKKKKNTQKSRQASSPSQAEAPASPTNSEGDSRSVRSHSWELVDLPSPEGTGVVVTPVHTSSTPSPARAMLSQGGTAQLKEGTLPLRAPVICVLGHTDAGKTKLLDRIRSSKVQEGEAGGISQHIGATMLPREALARISASLQRDEELEMKVPGLLLLDTPGHETFNNLRHRGSSICDVGIVVVDIMHGVEKQTKEAIALLRDQRRPFVLALNKVDRLYGWQPDTSASIRKALENQQGGTSDEFHTRWTKVRVQLAELGLNASLCWELGRHEKKDISVVPVSALTGEGIPDLLFLLSSFCQRFLSNRLAMKASPLVCTVLEVREVVGMGVCADVILVQGSLHEGDHISLRSRSSEVVTSTIRALVTPKPLEELRSQSGGAAAYNYYHSVTGTAAVRISGPNLSNVQAGSLLTVDETKARSIAPTTVTSPCVNLANGVGITMKCSSMGGVEALTKLVKDLRAPIGLAAIGDVHLLDIRKTSCVLSNHSKYGIVLAYDVKVNSDARSEAEKLGVRIIEGNVIYKLVEELKMYLEEKEAERQREEAAMAVFPCVVSIVPSLVLSRKPPLHFGLYVEEGVLRIGTPLCVASRKQVQLGKVVSMKSTNDEKAVEEATAGDTVMVRLTAPQNNVWLGSGGGLEENSKIVSYITRDSIDFLKAYHKDSVKIQDWELVLRLKKVFGIT